MLNYVSHDAGILGEVEKTGLISDGSMILFFDKLEI